jgi:arsenate reductase (thioredoxin)
MATPCTVLFLCTGNSARSIMAEAILNHRGKPGFTAYSAGSHPTGRVSPHALKTLQSAGLLTDHLRSKSWDECARPGAPTMDFVFTVCDNAANEVCPVWPGQPMTAHWGVPDPAAAKGTAEEIQKAFYNFRFVFGSREWPVRGCYLRFLPVIRVKQAKGRSSNRCKLLYFVSALG